MHEQILKEIKGDYGIVKRFEGGMSNFTYLVEDELHNKYVYRYPGKNNENFVNYEQLQERLKQVEILDISNKLVYYDSKTGIKISEYIEGRVADSDSDLSLIVEVLKKLHTSNIKFENYNHLERLEKYEALIENNNIEYRQLKEKWLNIYESILKQHIKYPTHGDSQLSNIIISTNGEVHLIDWEFAGLNDYIYDIAAFGNNGFDLALKLLNEYVEIEDDDKIRRLYGWRIFQCLQWYNVAVYKHNIGLSEELNLDFLEISKKYLYLINSLLKEYESIEA